MDETGPERPLDLREYLAVLRARKKIIIAVTTLVIALTLYWSFRQTPLYRAEARLLVIPISTDSSTYVHPPNLETESEVVSSGPVAALVAKDLGPGRPLDSLLSGLSVEPLAETEFLQVAYTSPDPAFAQRAANSFAQSYIDYRRSQALTELRSAQESVQKRIDSVEDRLTGISRELQQARRSRDAALIETLTEERDSLLAQLGVVQQRLDDLQPERPVHLGGGQIMKRAGLPSSPSSPNHMRNGFFGVFFGLLLGVGVALFRDHLDDRFRGRTDVEKVLDAPVLATVPKFDGWKKDYTGPIVIAQPTGSASEAYRTLRTNVQFLAAQYQLRSLLITSPSAGEGKTVTCANLAVSLAQAGSRVIVASADLRRPMIEKYFAVTNDGGLSTLLMGEEAEPWALIKDPGVPNLRILPSGPLPPNPAEILASPHLARIATMLEENCDVLLFDSPPTLGLADSAIMAARTSAALLVIDAGGTHRSQATDARQQLERVGSRIIGSVLNALDPATSPYHYYDYYYKSYYRHQDGDMAGQAAGNGQAWRPRPPRRGLWRNKKRVSS